MVTFDDHGGLKPTQPRRPRSSGFGLQRNKKRAATIWEFMDKATEGMAAAHEIIDLLEKDNRIFGRYLANEAEAERAADEAAAAEAAAAAADAFGFAPPAASPAKHQNVSLPPLDPAGGQRLGGVVDDGESCFLTGVDVPDRYTYDAPRAGDDDAPPSPGPLAEESTVIGHQDLYEEGLRACARLKRESKHRAAAGSVVLRERDAREVRDLKRSFAKPPDRTNGRKSGPPSPTPEYVERLAQPHVPPARLRHVPPPPAKAPFVAKPLPVMYRAAAPPSQDSDVAARSAAWLQEKQALRDAQRAERKADALSEVRSMPQVSDKGAMSWATAKATAARAAARDEAEAEKRAKQAAARVAAVEARRDAEAADVARARAALEAELSARAPPPPKPRPDAPIDRPTKASLRAASKHAKAAAEEAAAGDEAAAAPRDPYEDDPYAGLEPYQFNSEVLAILGDDGDASEDESTLISEAQAAARKLDATLLESPAYDAAELEDGQLGFFDPLSSAERGRKRVRDARLFQPSSMQRAVAEDGIVLLLGNLAEPPRSEHVICVLFDRAKFTEADAMRWWSATGRALCAN